jgi:hypothetical protein
MIKLPRNTEIMINVQNIKMINNISVSTATAHVHHPDLNPFPLFIS